jgi:hypothetical protein
VAGELQAKLGELAFEFLVPGVEVLVATGGQFFGQVEKA